MRKLFIALIVLAAPAFAQSPGNVRVEIVTDMGRMVADIDTVHAPVTGKNFLRYVDAGLFDSAVFFRTVRADNQPTDSVKISVIQQSLDPSRSRRAFPPIELERTTVTGLHHMDGELSMARSGVNTGSSQWFVVIGDNPSLDFGGHRNLDGQGFAAFGRVVSGMDVAKKIQAAPASGQFLMPVVRILTVRRVR